MLHLLYMKLNLRKRIHSGGNFHYVTTGLIAIMILIPYLASTRVLQHSSRNDSQEIVIHIVLFGLLPVGIVAYVIYMLLLNHMLKRRDKNLTDEVFTKNMIPSQFPLSTSLYMIAENKRDLSSKNSFLGSDWGFCDFQFSTYRRTKRSEYKAETSYYAVAVFFLPRKLPNVFFDSKNTGAREFKKLFRQSQRHSLEGDFDTHHTTYFHEDYTIDNLSFITPEVMLAISVAKNYDVEIYKDCLYLYNELENMPYQLNDMEEKGKNIRQKLLNNISTYRDERLKYGDGRKTVSLLGTQLRRSIVPRYINVILSAMGIISGIIFMMWEKAKYGNNSVFGLYATFFSAGFLVSNIKVIKSIKREDAHFKSMTNVGA